MVLYRVIGKKVVAQRTEFLNIKSHSAECNGVIDGGALELGDSNSYNISGCSNTHRQGLGTFGMG